MPTLPQVPGLLLREQLGAGGMGSVYRALELASDREVAVKLIPPHLVNERSLARLRREGELMGRLSDPAIAKVHGHGQLPGGGAYLVCELVPQHRRLDVVAREQGSQARLDLLQEVIRALSVAHAAGIQHRDLKPSNLLVDGSGQVKVIDFGVATAADLERMTKSEEFVGTWAYAPPEALTPGAERGLPGDVWALGALAYELLEGQPAYPLEGMADLARRLRPAPRPRRIPRRLAAVLQRALDPDPAARLPNAGQLLAAWKSARGLAQTGEQPGARSSSPGAWLGALLVVVVVAGGVVGPGWAGGARRETGPTGPAPSPPASASPGATQSPSAIAETEAEPGARRSPSIDPAAWETSILRELEDQRRDLLARARARERALQSGRSDGQPPPHQTLREAVREFVERAEAVFRGPRDPAALAWVATAQATLEEVALVSTSAEADALGDLLPRLVALDPRGPQAPGLRVARCWLNYLESAVRPFDPSFTGVSEGPTPGEPWEAVKNVIKQRLPAFGPWQLDADQRIRSLWASFTLLGGMFSAGDRPQTAPIVGGAPASEAVQAGAWPAGEAGRALRRRTRRVLIQLRLRRAFGLRAAGDELWRAALSDVERHVAELLADDPREAERQVAVVAAFVSGDLSRVRRRIEEVRDIDVRAYLRGELALAEGDAERALSATAYLRENKALPWPVRVGAIKLKNHVSCARQSGSRQRLLAKLAGAAEFHPHVLMEGFWLPWRTKAGLREVLQGAWWPGQERFPLVE